MEVKESELLIFDLDGTLIDSSDDIAWAANRTLVHMGYKELDLEVIKGGIGRGVRFLLETLMPGAVPDMIDTATGKFLEYYWSHLTVSTRLYPGVRDTITYFTELNKKMAIVTNKPIRFTEKVLEELDISRFFMPVLGGDSLENRKPHPEPLEKVIETLCMPKERAVFIGDSPVDCETGKSAGVATIGVEYGFRTRKELEDAGCEIIIKEFQELKNIIR